MSDVDAPDSETRITQPDAAKFLGNVSQMTLWRWRNNPALNFPRSIEINGRHYYSRAEILNWRPPAKPLSKPKSNRRQSSAKSPAAVA
jgi:predicted DNA-binding transcriptional regulator AlpA